MDLHNGRQYRDQTNTFAVLYSCCSHGGNASCSLLEAVSVLLSDSENLY
jgi:hypothetical protein